MLPKTKRLTKAEFDRFFKVARRQHSPNLQLLYTPQDTFSGAVVVGKKVFKQAVKRNQMRRRLYAALYRHHIRRDTTGVYIIIAKPGAKSVTRTALLAEVKTLLENNVSFRHRQ